MSLRAIASSFQSVNYQGTWDASTNNPALTSSVGTKGYYYVVSVAGSTNLNGITNWGVGDWAVFNGSVWQRVEGGADGNFVNLSVSGVATFAAGAVATPAITTTGDTNTGVWFPAADTIAVSTAGAERMRIDSAGQIIQGTSTGAVNGALQLRRNITGGTTAYIAGTSTTVQSDVTGQASSFSSFVNTAAASFTLNLLKHFNAQQGTIGATSAVTNQYGFFADSALVGATNNYGFYSDIASGTGRWNFYAAGTATNYFGGNVGIGTTTPTAKLSVVGTTHITGAGAFPTTGVGIELIPAVASGTNYIITYNRTGTAWQNLEIASAQTVFGTAGFERIRIASTGTISLGTAPGSESLRVTPVASAVNYVEALGSATGVSPSLTAAGSDANLDFKLITKGTGVVQYGTYTAGVVAQAGYITIKDAGGTTRRLLVG
jgi:hypothetical protein